MKTKSEILETLSAVKSYLKKQYKVKDIWAFGSVVRGDQTIESDIDILVDFEEGADLFTLVGLGLFLEEKLNHKVDIVPRRALREEIKEFVLGDIIAL